MHRMQTCVAHTIQVTEDTTAPTEQRAQTERDAEDMAPALESTTPVCIDAPGVQVHDVKSHTECQRASLLTESRSQQASLLGRGHLGCSVRKSQTLIVR